MVVSAGERSSFKLFKLHGSVNWFYSGATSYQGELLYDSPVTEWGKPIGDIELQARRASSDKVPLIVPPTTEKVAYFQHETIRQIWLRASAALQSADRVFCIGYSLPTTDLGVRFFLLHGKPNVKVPLFIVNKDPNSVGHYASLLGASYEIDGKYASTGIETFCAGMDQDVVN
jgi:hypothetical protein